MECFWSSIFWLSALALLLVLVPRGINRISTKSRPPGPLGWPVIGNTLDLVGDVPPQTLYTLRAKYGPVMWLQLGSVGTLVVQSAKAAADLFKNHDLAISDRRPPGAFTVDGYNHGSLALAKYGPYWRMIRKLCSSELFSKPGHDALRRKCVDDMITWIEEDVEASKARGGVGEVVVSRFLFFMTFNLIGNMMFSKDLLGLESEDGDEFFDAMKKLLEWAGTQNVADFFPYLKWVDPGGVQRGASKEMARTMKIVDRFVEERTKVKSLEKEKIKRDFLDALLDYEGDGKGPQKISAKNIKIIVLEMFFGGSETTSSTMEWALTELLRRPETMRKAQAELDMVVGGKRKVEESDIEHLPYLQGVIKETLRLHPSLPLLVPRNTIEDINYMGYHVPKNTQVFVNAWAIGRDPEFWDDPMAFKPERFLDTNIDYKGQHYGIIPFGSGRRICAGIPVAHKVLHLTIATLLQRFDWELAGHLTPENIDMSERMGAAVRKLEPLEAIPRKRNFEL